jgi:hypothetical protein
MSGDNLGQGIGRELSVSELVSETLDIYKKDFVKYFVQFVIVEAIIGVLDTLVRSAFLLPTLPTNPTPQQFLAWAPGFFGALIGFVVLSATVVLVFFPVAQGTAIKMTSESIVKGQVDLNGSVRFALSKLVLMWILGIVVGVIVLLGIIALVIPGIILAIMLSMALPALLLENKGIADSMSRSRELVGQRWLKTLVVFIVFAIIIGVAAAVLNAIGGLFGFAGTFVSSVLSALYQPIFPIAVTVYFYSNVARVTGVQGAVPQATNIPVSQGGFKFCPSCGTQLASAATYCSKCGARQPA